MFSLYPLRIFKRLQTNNISLPKNISKESYSRNVEKLAVNGLFLKGIKNHEIKTENDWRIVKENIINDSLNRGQISNKNFDALLMGYCTATKEFDLAHKYIQYLNSKDVTPNLATTGRYLRLLYEKNNEKCSKEDEIRILSIYESINEKYKVLDSISLENIILGLSVTKKWKDCLKLLQEIEKTTVPNSQSYCATINAAFRNKKEQLGLDLLNEMIAKDRIPDQNTYITYLTTVKTTKKSEAIEKIEMLFKFIQTNDLRISNEVALALMKVFRKIGYTADSTKINFRSNCKNCNKTLQRFDLTDDEFTELKNKIIENVIVGRDVFVKTTPQELNKFNDFISNIKPFDVVLDGLNIAYSSGTRHTPNVYSSLVAAVVSHFVEQEKTVLLLGRYHMNKWPPKNWGYVKENATVFLTQDISEDDPYLLYCALNSGKNTTIVTRDLMRGHKFLLRDPRLKILFNRWLNQSQYQLIRVNETGKPIFKLPLPYSVVPQKIDDNWHVPYEIDTAKNEYSNTWICLHK